MEFILVLFPSQVYIRKNLISFSAVSSLNVYFRTVSFRTAPLLTQHFLRPQSGQAMTEFIISIISFLFVTLGIIQMSLCVNAQSLVRYAAYNAARAGIVHGGSKEKMNDAARISLLSIYPRHGRADNRLGVSQNYQAALKTDNDESMTYLNRKIIEVKLLNEDRYNGGSVVTFDDPRDSKNALITVQVEHQYELVIPLVNRILFYVYNWRYGNKSGNVNQTLDKLSAETHKSRTGGEFKDIEYRIPLIAEYTMRLQSDYDSSKSDSKGF